MKFFLVISHLLAIGTGYFLFPQKQSDPPNPTHDQRSRTLRSRDPLPQTENPLRHATSADYQQLFEEMILSPAKSGRLDKLLRAWSMVDPEAAVLSFTKYYNPEQAGHLLQYLQKDTGSRLAAPLVKHYAQLEFLHPSKLYYALGGSLGVLATEDLDQALKLIGTLPPKTVEQFCDHFIDQLDGPQLLQLFERISNSSDHSYFTDSQEFWKESINRIWRQLSPEQFNQLFHKLDQGFALQHLSHRAMEEAYRFNEHDALLKTLNSLPEEKLVHVIEGFNLSQYKKVVLNSPLLLQAAEEHNATELLERLKPSKE